MMYYNHIVPCSFLLPHAFVIYTLKCLYNHCITHYVWNINYKKYNYGNLYLYFSTSCTTNHDLTMVKFVTFISLFINFVYALNLQLVLFGFAEHCISKNQTPNVDEIKEKLNDIK